MYNLILRFIRHPLDYSHILKITSLTLLEKIDEGNNVYSFIFTAPKLPNWQAGQHAIFTFPNHKIEGKSWRAFSIASAPHESVIRISTIISDTPSDFKMKLQQLQIGENIRMFGPFGEMYIRPKIKKVVAIAGGIGITPFRSIICDLAKKQSNLSFTLIYSARERNYAFYQNLEQWCVDNPNIKIIYTETSEEVNQELEKQILQHKNNAHYLLSGSPGMIEALCNKIRSLHVKASRILNDPFKGY